MTAERPLRLGDVLLEKKWISEQNLKEALAYQKEHGGLLGNILVDHGWVDEAKIQEATQLLPQKGKLGELLMELGVLTEDQLNAALSFQEKSGGALGEILLSLGFVDPQTLFRMLASQNGMGRIGSQFAMDFSIRIPEEDARELNAIVLRTNVNRAVVAVVKILSEDQVNRLEFLLSRKIEQVLANYSEMELLWNMAYASELMTISTDKLAQERPDQSARTIFTKRQIAGIIILLGATILGLFVNPFKTSLTVNILIQGLYFLVASLKFLMIWRGTAETAQIRITDEDVAAIDERDLPVYTILVPMYKESRVIPKLLANLERLDYPKHKLDIRLLIEEDDKEAQELLKSIGLMSSYTTIIVPHYTTLVLPHSLPKTKPKACNYGLINARGKYVVIYDAEDRPDPDQLKKVYLAFQRSSASCCCIQAKLNYYNSEHNLLTRWFTQEYSMWFDLLLPGLMQLNIPIPLGGTSNHFITETLKKLDAWDPYNVTEDADPGIRLYAAGCTTGIVNSRTWEEANSKLGNWIRQRSRWIKGYMQTWLVHMRFPLRLLKQVGLKGMLGLQVITLATPLLPLINPFLWLMVLLWFTTYYQLIPRLFPGPIYYLAAIELLVGNFLFIFSNVIGIYWVVNELHASEDYALSFRLVKYALLTPVYWILMSVAAYKAAWQLITKPFYWEKTEHGLTDNDSFGPIFASMPMPVSEIASATLDEGSEEDSQVIVSPSLKQKGHANKGYMLLKLGLWRQAISEFQKAVAASPYSTAVPVLLLEIASAYSELGEFKMAGHELAKAEILVELSKSNS